MQINIDNKYNFKYKNIELKPIQKLPNILQYMLIIEFYHTEDSIDAIRKITAPNKTSNKIKLTNKDNKTITLKTKLSATIQNATTSDCDTGLLKGMIYTTEKRLQKILGFFGGEL